MSYDIDILRIVEDKDKWERFAPLIKKHNVSAVTKNIFDTIGDYWDNYPGSTKLDWGQLKTFFYIVKGKKLKQPELYDAAFKNVEETTSTALLADIEKHLIEQDYATRIYNEVLGIASGRSGTSLSNVRSLLDGFDKEWGTTIDASSVFVPPTLGYVAGVAAAPGLRWRLEEFNISMGPIRQGDFIILGARPEAGKTTMILSEATFMLGQLPINKHVIIVNNEESSSKVMMRAIQAYFQVTTGELLANVAKYEAAFAAAGGNRFLITADTAKITPQKLERMLTEFPPGLIIFDQLDKVKGFKNDRDDLRIGALYNWARDLAKEHCPIIAVSQLDGSAEGEKYVTMDHLRGSKTDKPGEADAIIMLGDARDGTLNRYISIAKNKLMGDSHTLEAHRHGCFQVTIDPSKARYVSAWKAT